MDILPPLPLSALSQPLLSFLCDSLILCPSYGLRVSPHFIDSVGALPYPSPELHSAWQIPIRPRPRHEQKSHCDQACVGLPMSLLALAAPAAWLFEQGWDFSLQSAGGGGGWWMQMIQFRVKSVDGCSSERAGIPGRWPLEDRKPPSGCSFLKGPLWTERVRGIVILSFSLKGKVHQLVLEKPNGFDFRGGKNSQSYLGCFKMKRQPAQWHRLSRPPQPSVQQEVVAEYG